MAHSDPALIGQDISELLGPEILAATEDGNWVTTESMRMWVAGSGGYIFGAGWHPAGAEEGVLHEPILR